MASPRLRGQTEAQAQRGWTPGSSPDHLRTGRDKEARHSRHVQRPCAWGGGAASCPPGTHRGCLHPQTVGRRYPRRARSPACTVQGGSPSRPHPQVTAHLNHAAGGPVSRPRGRLPQQPGRGVCGGRPVPSRPRGAERRRPPASPVVAQPEAGVPHGVVHAAAHQLPGLVHRHPRHLVRVALAGEAVVLPRLGVPVMWEGLRKSPAWGPGEGQGCGSPCGGQAAGILLGTIQSGAGCTVRPVLGDGGHRPP